MSRITIAYYSSTGSVHALAEAMAEGARQAGGDVRLRRVAELVPQDVIDRNPEWRDHLEATDHIPTATVADLAWADGFALGTPARFGQPAAQVKQFLDSSSAAWQEGAFVDKPATGFTSAYERHGGHEAVLLALYHTFYHWGSIVLPTGYVDQDLAHQAGGNPYGVSSIAADGPPRPEVLELARFQGRRLTTMAALLAAREGAAA
jgi:NAD(P)H dehydrogenase (quinone)